MKRQLAFPLALVLGAARIFAFEYGLDVSNDTSPAWDAGPPTTAGGAPTMPGSLTQQNRATAYLSQNIGKESDIYISGYVEFKGSFSNEAPVTNFDFNLDRSEYTGSMTGLAGPTSVLRWNLGRVFLSDFSGRILAGLYDGAHAEFALGNLTLSGAAAYTGLLFKDQALLYIGPNDAAINALADSSRLLAPRHLLGSLGARFVELLPGHDIGLETWGQFDLEPITAALPGPATHSVYAEPFIEGGIGRNLKWRGWGVYEFIYDGSPHNSLAAGGLVRVSIPELASLRVTGSAAWASGATALLGADLSSFIPIMAAPLGSASTFTFRNSFGVSLDVAGSPIRNLTTSGNAMVLFRTSDIPMGAIYLVQSATETKGQTYLGTEATLRAAYRFTNDLSLSGSAGLFLPNTATYFLKDTPPRVTASLSATFSL